MIFRHVGLGHVLSFQVSSIRVSSRLVVFRLI
jgi:hypothetical protein